MSKTPAVKGKEAEQVQMDLEGDSSLRDTLEAAFKGEEPENEAEETEETEVEEQEAAEEEAEGAEQAASGGDSAESDEGDEEAAASGEEADDGEAEADSPLEPPHHWSAADQKTFLDAPRESQEFLLRRHKEMEGDYTNKTKELAPLRTVVDKWQGYMGQVGMTADQAFDNLMNAEYQLRTSPPERKRQILMQLGKEYGIDLDAQAQAQQDDTVDPYIQQTVQPLQEEIQSLKTQLDQQQVSSQQAVNAAIVQQIEDFKSAKDDKGNLKNPYFEEVYPMMVSLAQADQAVGKQSDLADLYNRSCWATDSVREKLQLTQQRAVEQKHQAEKKAKAKKAKEASASITGSPSGTTEQPKSLREELEVQFGVA